MNRFLQVTGIFVFGAVLGLATTGCGSGDAAVKNGDKMDAGKMEESKMNGDKMGAGKMSDGKMAGDKMGAGKMSGDKMANDKMKDEAK